MHFHLTEKSRNAKTGPIPVSTSSADTCPDVCPLRGAGCYADGGPLAIHWRKVSAGSAGGSWINFLGRVAALPDGALWRHNQAGDLAPDNDGDIDPIALAHLVRANRGKAGFTYTHYSMDKPQNRVAVSIANREGFTVNLSANNLVHADTLADYDCGPVVVLLPADAPRETLTPKGRRVATCPATYRDDITCASCGLCAKPQRKVIVGFPAHGMRKGAAGALASTV